MRLYGVPAKPARCNGRALEKGELAIIEGVIIMSASDVWRDSALKSGPSRPPVGGDAADDVAKGEMAAVLGVAGRCDTGEYAALRLRACMQSPWTLTHTTNARDVGQAVAQHASATSKRVGVRMNQR